MRRLACALALAFTLLLLGTVRADAHAELESTQPAAGTATPESPKQVVLSFTEPIDVSAGGVRVFDAEGARVDRGRNPAHKPGDRSAVVLDLPDLEDGSYVVSWRVVSQDSHPIHGAYTFRVGEGTAGPDASATDVVGRTGSRSVGILFGVVRFLAFLSLLVLVGGAAFIGWLWPAGWSDQRARRVLVTMAGVAAVVTVLGIGLQGAYGAGLSLADAFSPNVVRPVLETRFGQVWAGRLVLLAVFVVFLALLRKRRAAAVDAGITVLVGGALLATPGLSGHAASGDLRMLALPTDAVHMAAAAVWLGGLALLLVCVLGPGTPDAALVATRFSRVALWAVAVLVVTGSFQSWRQVRELDALTGTNYGRSLMVKLGLFAGLVGLAALSRALVRRRGAANGGGGGATPLAALRKTVLAEVVVALAVLAATAVLVNNVPARAALAQPVTKELQVGRVLVDLTIDPAKAGPATIHLYSLTPEGQPLEVEEATVSLRLPRQGIGPLVVPLSKAGPGHYAAYAFDIPVAGQWDVDVSVRTSEIDLFRAATRVRIR